MTSFERLVTNRMNSLAENQNNLYELCQNRFQQFDERFQGIDARFLNLDEQIEVVQNQLFELQYGKAIEDLCFHQVKRYVGHEGCSKSELREDVGY